jgi:two-component system NtrC family sensor kinase
MLETVELNGFLTEVVELMEREARAAGVAFVTDLEAGLPPIVSDPSQLQQVFLNLMTNAVDAHEGKAGGTIRVATRLDPEGKKVEVEVRDTGCGIPAEHLERVFDPFFTTKPVGRGTGLGLSICYGIMNRLGGEIDVESEPGQGSRFRLLLPLTPPDALRESMRREGRQGPPG